MKSIRLLSAKFTNFKGIQNLTIEFGKVTSIFGTNGIGKSSLADGFSWCLWGKDQQERKDHEIKNTVHKDLNRQDHEAELVFDVDSRHIPVKRVYAEKWTKKRGSNDQEFTGHETTLWFDDIPLPLKDFTARVNDLLEESIFKLISNPHYFNSLNWKDRRGMLINMAGEITNQDVAKGNPAYSDLLEILKTKSVEDYKTQISSQRKKINDTLKEIPVKIGEATHNMPEDQDWKALESDLKEKKSKVDELEGQIEDKSKALESFYQADQKRLSEINNLKSKCQNLKWDAEKKAEQKNRDQGKEIEILKVDKESTGKEIKKLTEKQDSISSEIQSLIKGIETQSNERETLLTQYHERNAEKFAGATNDINCPTCGEPFKGDNLEQQIRQMESSFNSKKQSELSSIMSEGTRIKNSIENKSKQLDSIKNELHEVSEKLESEESKYYDLDKKVLAESKKDVKEYSFKEFLSDESQTIESEIQKMEAIKSDSPKIDTSELKERKKEVQAQIESISNQLSQKETIEKAKTRIKELEKEERELANKVSELEGIENTIQQFINDKMSMVEESVNNNFQFVRFKMFNTLINGGTEETCETMLDGVPWSTLNTGGKLKAGIDIINAFSKYYEINAPMILDNRESVFEIPETKNQVINLVASENDNKLRVEIKG